MSSNSSQILNRSSAGDSSGNNGGYSSSGSFSGFDHSSRPVSNTGLRAFDNTLHPDRSRTGTPSSLDHDESSSEPLSRDLSRNASGRSSLSAPGSMTGPASPISAQVHAFVDLLSSKLDLTPAQIGDLHNMANVRDS